MPQCGRGALQQPGKGLRTASPWIPYRLNTIGRRACIQCQKLYSRLPSCKASTQKRSWGAASQEKLGCSVGLGPYIRQTHKGSAPQVTLPRLKPGGSPRTPRKSRPRPGGIEPLDTRPARPHHPRRRLQDCRRPPCHHAPHTSALHSQHGAYRER